VDVTICVSWKKLERSSRRYGFVCGWKKVLSWFRRKGKSNGEYLGLAAPELREHEDDAVVSYAFPAAPQP
jgi:hypothetical protein